MGLSFVSFVSFVVQHAVTDTWNPAQYDKFQREREQPFFDLLALVRPATEMRIVDLGCGTGKLTRLLHERLQARETIGIDRSARMLEQSQQAGGCPGLIFETGTIESFPPGCYSGPADHPQVVGGSDDLFGDFGGRADCKAIILADDFKELTDKFDKYFSPNPGGK